MEERRERKVEGGENTWEITARRGTANICTVIHKGAAEILKVNREGSNRTKTLGCVISSYNTIVLFFFFRLSLFNTEFVKGIVYRL
jgi:hypothetical protein